ncbi:MAG: LapA family protein [Gammaproteobacteria bacterium]|nr:LapA family protein [Gammaproteobacteria bacterium]
MRLLKLVLILLMALLGVSFACLNAQPVLINYYIGNSLIPFSLLLVFALILGSLLGALALFMLYLRQKTLTLRLQHRLKLAEKELANLRTLPLKEHES